MLLEVILTLNYINITLYLRQKILIYLIRETKIIL